MTVRLRAHHLLCVLTYVGKGYGADFVAGYDRVVARLSAGEEAELVEGPDEVCGPLTDPDRHCLNPSAAARDARAAEAVAALLGRPIAPGVRLRLDRPTLRLLRGAVAAGEMAEPCAGCPWLGLCREVAGSGFEGARLVAQG